MPMYRCGTRIACACQCIDVAQGLELKCIPNRLDAWKSARLDLKSKVAKLAKVAKTSFLKKMVQKYVFPMVLTLGHKLK